MEDALKGQTILISRLESMWGLNYILSEVFELGLEDLLSLNTNATTDDYVGEEDRSKEYHKHRIEYFVSQLLQGKDLDPIEVDNECCYGRIYPQPVVVDGHHRLFAYILVGRDEIPVHYGGLVSVLDYLQGKTEFIVQ